MHALPLVLVHSCSAVTECWLTYFHHLLLHVYPVIELVFLYTCIIYHLQCLNFGFPAALIVPAQKESVRVTRSKSLFDINFGNFTGMFTGVKLSVNVIIGVLTSYASSSYTFNFTVTTYYSSFCQAINKPAVVTG
jgi:hypothetical protein